MDEGRHEGHGPDDDHVGDDSRIMRSEEAGLSDGDRRDDEDEESKAIATEHERYMAEENQVKDEDWDRDKNDDQHMRHKGGRGGSRGQVDSEERYYDSGPRRGPGSRRPREFEESMSLLVRHLRYESDNDRVRKVFERYGRVKDVYLPLDYHTRKPRGFGFVEFYDARDAERALRELHNTDLDGSRISISVAQHGRKSPDSMRVRPEDRPGPYGRPPPYGYDGHRRMDRRRYAPSPDRYREREPSYGGRSAPYSSPRYHDSYRGRSRSPPSMRYSQSYDRGYDRGPDRYENSRRPPPYERGSGPYAGPPHYN